MQASEIQIEDVLNGGVNSYVLIDVRSENEYQKGHMSGSINIPLLSKIYVIEMNNETNTISGIGLITNKVIPKMHKIYSDQNYNRYTYYGKKWIPSNCIDKETLESIEKRLFQGKNHLKRSHGIVEVPQDVKSAYLNYIQELFKLVFC